MLLPGKESLGQAEGRSGCVGREDSKTGLTGLVLAERRLPMWWKRKWPGWQDGSILSTNCPKLAARSGDRHLETSSNPSGMFDSSRSV